MLNTLPQVDLLSLDLQAWNRAVLTGSEVSADLARAMINHLTGAVIPMHGEEIEVYTSGMGDGHSFRVTLMNGETVLDDRIIYICDGSNPDFRVGKGVSIKVNVVRPLDNASLSDAKQSRTLELEFSTEPGIALIAAREFSMDHFSHRPFDLLEYNDQGSLVNANGQPDDVKRDLRADFRLIAHFQNAVEPAKIR